MKLGKGAKAELRNNKGDTVFIKVAKVTHSVEIDDFDRQFKLSVNFHTSNIDLKSFLHMFS